MRKLFLTLMLTCLYTAGASAQTKTLSLDSCRALALSNNKQLNAKRLKQDVAENIRKSARTQYLPKVDAVGGYEFMSREISLLNNDQKYTLGNIGSIAMGDLNTKLSTAISGLAQNGLISLQTAGDLGTILNTVGQPLAQAGNELGTEVKDAFRTDTRNIWTAAVMLRQPIYMGGAITAANKMADIAGRMAALDTESATQNTIYDIDKTYWLVVSLHHKKQLAESFLGLVQKLNGDVHKLIEQGIATRADGLKVDVKVNEAEMALTQVDNGLALARMLLCQQCGLPLESDIRLADENGQLQPLAATDDTNSAFGERAELQLLEDAIELSRQSTKLVKAAFLPQVALTGGYMLSNPNVFNGFQNKFGGVWNVGVMVRVPVWNWMEGTYKVRAGKTATAIACLELDEVREKIDLQQTQCKFKVKEANKRLAAATRNVANAEENLRCANIGFREGVMESTDVMAAQTAWNAAMSQKIDAEIEVRLADVNLRRAQGILK